MFVIHRGSVAVLRREALNGTGGDGRVFGKGVVFGALVSDQQPMPSVPRLVLHKLVQSPRVPQDTRQAMALFLQLGEELDRLMALQVAPSKRSLHR